MMETMRKPHASLELLGRSRKARKIERLLGLSSHETRLRLLEVGAGSGGISHYFATHTSERFEVDAVDVYDNRQSKEGYRFTLVEGTKLPFADAAFDVVLSNHVIEHVGDDDAQNLHLAEIRRVMREDGIGYLAMPSRWALIEPHYRLALLSWWPESWRSGWLRVWGKGNFYDCRPLSCRDIEARLSRVGFQFEQLHADALRATFDIEHPDAPLWRCLLKHVPDAVWRMARSAFPTLIYRLHKR